MSWTYSHLPLSFSSFISARKWTIRSSCQNFHRQCWRAAWQILARGKFAVDFGCTQRNVNGEIVGTSISTPIEFGVRPALTWKPRQSLAGGLFGGVFSRGTHFELMSLQTRCGVYTSIGCQCDDSNLPWSIILVVRKDALNLFICAGQAQMSHTLCKIRNFSFACIFAYLFTWSILVPVCVLLDLADGLCHTFRFCLGVPVSSFHQRFSSWSIVFD